MIMFKYLQWMRNMIFYRIMFFFIVINILNIFFVYHSTKDANIFSHPHRTNDISCYSVTEEDFLGEPNSSLLRASNNIFFVETSCRGYIDARQACAIESAARAHPHRKVHVFFSGPMTSKAVKSGVILKLKDLFNVNFVRIKLHEALQGTPLERLITEGLLKKSMAPVSHTSDVVRMLLLWQFGGVYLDLDVITLKPFDDLPQDFAGVEDEERVGSAVLGISKSAVGRKFATSLIRTLGMSFNPREWAANGPELITNNLYLLCKTFNLSMMNAKNCEGFEVYARKVFYPMKAARSTKFWSLEDIDLNGSYTIHLWNKLTHPKKISKNSFLSRLAQKFCPTVHGLFWK